MFSSQAQTSTGISCWNPMLITYTCTQNVYQTQPTKLLPCLRCHDSDISSSQTLTSFSVNCDIERSEAFSHDTSQMIYFCLFQVEDDLFDDSVLQHAKDDEEARVYADISAFRDEDILI